VLTSELIKSSSPEAVGTVERLLVQAISSATDAVAFDPNTVGSLTAGAPEITSTGDLGDGIAAVLDELSGGVASRPALVLGAAAARLLVFSGDDIFRDVALAGSGTFAGIPTFTSPSRAIANLVIGIDRDGVVTADGGIDIASGGHATLQMDDAPDSPATASTVTVALWQSNLISLRAIRYLRSGRPLSG
jgi:hypothetical protein